MDSALLQLDHFLLRNGAVETLSPIIERLRQKLDKYPALPQAWQTLADDVFGMKLPAGIVSSWLFVLRGGGKFHNERHPNSWQRSFALRGRALFETYHDDSWREHPLDGAGVAIDRRAISIPPNVWHRITIGPEPFFSLSFHTVAAAELIEETCVGDDFSQTRRRLYQE